MAQRTQPTSDYGVEILDSSQTDEATVDADIVLRKVSLSLCVGVAPPANRRRRRAEEGVTELLIDVGRQSQWRRRAGMR